MPRPTAPSRRTSLSCCAFLSPSPLNSLRALDAFLCVAPILHSLLCRQFLECLTDRKAEGMNRLDQLCRNVLRVRGDECLQLRRDLRLQHAGWQPVLHRVAQSIAAAQTVDRVVQATTGAS